MNCPRCRTVNPDDAKFCENCGLAFERACPNCGKVNSINAKFCRNCGYALAATTVQPARVAVETAPPPASTQSRLQQYIPRELLAKLESARASRSMQGERRIVTVLFSDVKGSTALAEQMDPEEWAEIMNGAFEHLIPPVYRYEGTLARLMGDAILAFFGAPIAHEDDPQRAVLAGLSIIQGVQGYREQLKRKYGMDFNVRVGINTGLVVVGEVGSDLRVEYTAMGDAVNLASRMEQTAQPGTVQISGNTYRLIAPLFDVEPLGGIEVRGRSEPVPAYRVVSPKATPGRLRGIEGLEAPLIGRKKEMDQLRQAVAGLREGSGQLVSVMGEAGLGKSRLVAELRQSDEPVLPVPSEVEGSAVEGWRVTSDAETVAPSPATRHPSRVLWYEGRSLSYESATPYAPFVNLFNSVFDLRAEDTDAQKYAKLRARVAEVMPEQVEDTSPFLASLLRIQFGGEDFERVKYLMPPDLREKIFQATFNFFERLAATQPLVLVFEDLHWIDPTSLDLVERLMALTDRATVMVLGIFRPQRQEPSWRFHEVASRDYAHRYTPIALEPLDEAHSRELVANLLHIEDLPERVRLLILRKAEGNPFFVEEVIRSLLDARLVVRDNGHWRATREIENIAVPDTLAGVIVARLDRLDDESKHVAQTASVIGRQFQYETLAEVYEARETLDPALSTLQRRELVREKTRLPQREYLFKHALTQETAYSSVLLSKRRELHRKVAECLERKAPEHVNDIARHFIEAREIARALPYVVEAGDRAAKGYAAPEAIGWYTRGLEILKTTDDPQLARRMYEGLGGVLMLSSNLQRAAETYHEMLRYAEAHDDIPMKVSALNKLSNAVMYMGQFEELEKHLVEAEQLAQAYRDLAGLTELYTIRCGVCNMAGDFDNAAKYLRESYRIGQQLNIKEQMAFGLTHTASTMTHMTRLDEAWKFAQEAWQLSQDIGASNYLAELLTYIIPFHHLQNGDVDAARQAAEEGTELARKIGVAFTEAIGTYILGILAQLRGEYERALSLFQRAHQAARASGYTFVEVMPLAAQGTVYLDISEKFAARAAELDAEALELMESPAGAPGGGAAWAELGFQALAQGDLNRAHDFFQKGLTIPTIQRLENRPRFLVGAAFVALARGQLDEAKKLVAEARAFVEERRMQFLYPLVEFADAHVSAAQADHARALEHFTRAESLASEMHMRPLLWQARAGAAQALSTLGRGSEAETKLKEARDTVDEIAQLFTDEQLKAAFLDSAMRKLGTDEL